MHPGSTTVRRALGLGLMAMLVVLVPSACGGGEKESKARLLPEDEIALPPGEYRSEGVRELELLPSRGGLVEHAYGSFGPLAYRAGRGGGVGFVVTRRVYKPSKTGTPNVVEAPKDLVGWYRRHPYLRTTDPKPVTVGGVEGVRFDLAVAEELPEGYRGICGTECVDIVKVADGRVLWQTRFERTRLIVLKDVEGKTVTVSIHGLTTEFDEFAPEAQKVMDTVKWTGS